jgi:hypothetical protein
VLRAWLRIAQQQKPSPRTADRTEAVATHG